ncbi:putative mitochondrial f1f0-atp synthase g [Phaeomoniella chlamydospora]|uniref:Putative mitochondrial f1f0-atp synthase g n=1 Tax=Phaeomoniella chlamydospora TaxID=158046 RepID=A0A0G2EK77_PHACM|nr:putative mitochondrial f1f0-atp synthase g [Phaeomoniella chlamydospora]
MSSVATTRTVVRQSRFFLRHQQQTIRHASSTGEASAKAKETASSAVSKASEGLTRVTSTAGPAISNAVSGAGNALRKVGGRTGKVVAFVDSLIPPTVYYSKVGLELAKLVFKGQNMYPPNLQTFQAYFQPLINAAKSPQTLLSKASQATSSASSYTPETILSSVRNVNRQQLATIGVLSAEVLGFFTVGTMIGKMKVVGYRGETGHEHH